MSLERKHLFIAFSMCHCICVRVRLCPTVLQPLHTPVIVLQDFDELLATAEQVGVHNSGVGSSSTLPWGEL